MLVIQSASFTSATRLSSPPPPAGARIRTRQTVVTPRAPAPSLALAAFARSPSSELSRACGALSLRARSCTCLAHTRRKERSLRPPSPTTIDSRFVHAGHERLRFTLEQCASLSLDERLRDLWRRGLDRVEGDVVVRRPLPALAIDPVLHVGARLDLLLLRVVTDEEAAIGRIARRVRLVVDLEEHDRSLDRVLRVDLAVDVVDAPVRVVAVVGCAVPVDVAARAAPTGLA